MITVGLFSTYCISRYSRRFSIQLVNDKLLVIFIHVRLRQMADNSSDSTDEEGDRIDGADANLSLTSAELDAKIRRIF